MSILHVPHYTHHDLYGTVRGTLEKALRAVVAALDAVMPVANVSKAAVAVSKKKELRALRDLANRYEAMSPSLATELHFIARQ
jgi:hypothetical protein